jgi:hypothetical protein
MKIFREKPGTLQGAILIATNDNNLRQRVSMAGHHFKNNTEHEPLKTDQTRGLRCFKCNLKGHC